MSFQTVWYETKMPEEIINIFEKDLENVPTEDGQVGQVDNFRISYKTRKSKIGWVGANCWFSGLLYSYILKANNENFFYDINGFEADTIQYSIYTKDSHYTWHTDMSLPNFYHPTKNTEEDFVKLGSESVRKLSVSLQLSGEDEYEGGEMQFLDDNNQLYTAPKSRGTVIIFDSRAKHRVRKVKSGCRRSIVGWVVGPRWK